jgi:hypothetical protein
LLTHSDTEQAPPPQEALQAMNAECTQFEQASPPVIQRCAEVDNADDLNFNKLFMCVKN